MMPRILLSLLLCIFVANTHAAVKATATVDRTVITQGDSFILTVRIDDTGGYDAPDYRPLEKDFQIFGSSQSSQHVINNGRIESATEWQVTLVPNRSGQLVIPALTVAGTTTAPIAVHVNPANSNSNTADADEPVFIEVQTDRNAVYVQQQLLLTARVFIAEPLSDMQLTKPEFDNANVKQVSETTFQRTLNGTTYEVHELVYAIFPQQPGELTIPELVFSAVEATRPRSLFDFPGQGRALRRLSRQLQVHIKPVPKSFTGSVWLPARNLTLSESWNGDPHHATVGESITRNIAVRADGLPAAQLPAIEQPTLDNAKMYADQPALDDQQDASGIHGKRVDKAAMIPTRSGRLQLPEVRVTWWDIDSDSEKVATLAGQTFQIGAGATSNNTDNTSNLSAMAPAGQSEANEQPTQAASKESNGLTQAQPIPASTRTHLLWQIAAAAFALLWLTTLQLYMRLKTSLRTSAVATARSARIAADEDSAWRDFKAACRANDPNAARGTLLRWARIHFADSQLVTCEQLLRAADNQPFALAWQQLENRLYGTRPDSGEWNGETLLEAAKGLKDTSKNKPATTDQLPPLYPVR